MDQSSSTKRTPLRERKVNPAIVARVLDRVRREQDAEKRKHKEFSSSI